jgi:stage II sporulation protein D
MKIRYLLFLFAIWLGGCAIAPRANAPSENIWKSGAESSSPEDLSGPQIRVAIAARQEKVHLVAPESFTMSGFPWGTPVVQKGEKRYREVTLTSEQLYDHKAFIEPSGDGQIQVNGKNFRGSMEIITESEGTLTVINQLPLEEYVMGVLAGEIPGNWPREALKAQAIASRTFAVLKQTTARQNGKPYDLENTALFQMYEGSGLVNDNIRHAVLETRGQIATYNSTPIAAFFHANCGGGTCGALEVWDQDKPYLKPVSCTFGNNGTHFRWQAEIQTRDLVRKLRAVGIKIGDVVRLEPIDRDESGRILKLSIMDSDGTKKTMKGSTFRMAVGPDLIRSTRFTVEVGQNKLIFSGKGWGHGVGLCQEGACGMALKGYAAFDILRYYYHGIMLEKMQDIH